MLEHKTRSILLFGPNESTSSLAERLAEQQWKVFLTEEKNQFRKLFQHHLFEVVVVFLSQDEEPSISEFEELASINIATKWIAVIPSEDWFENHPNFLFSHLFYDYHRQPLRFDYFLATIGHAYGMAELQNRQLSQMQLSSSNEEIIGKSPASMQLKKTINKVALEDATVLITGESGTGKELAARNIHQRSRRKNGPFVAINCAAIPETLFYSELFGHEKGAFTNADSRHIGRIESADGGTVFLDEIGDLPLNLQTNLLRFLELNQIERLGSVVSVNVDCRIIVATNVDLKQAVNDGHFREDLYHRINVLPLHIPPLRTRREDVPILANFFLDQFSKGHVRKNFTQNCFNAMSQYHWPGNVRELMNRVRRGVILSEGHLISEQNLDLNIGKPQKIESLQEARNKAERETIIHSIESAGYNHTQAAKDLGISRTSLYRLLNKHNIPM
ncbi:MAG: sigma-54-dependent Fis family transcriptional regulator [Kangiellaceae bacterium]|nr:sigma-54-dependent Fis family transcriptional regulator [Kangiellaceae bacterium]